MIVELRPYILTSQPIVKIHLVIVVDPKVDDMILCKWLRVYCNVPLVVHNALLAAVSAYLRNT